MLNEQSEADQLTEDFINKLSGTKFYQAECAAEYSKLIAYQQHYLFDWPKINSAITNKWSQGGMVRVKTAAWKLLET